MTFHSAKTLFEGINQCSSEMVEELAIKYILKTLIYKRLRQKFHLLRGKRKRLLPEKYQFYVCKSGKRVTFHLF